jgi:hypothetical protein
VDIVIEERNVVACDSLMYLVYKVPFRDRLPDLLHDLEPLIKSGPRLSVDLVNNIL